MTRALIPFRIALCALVIVMAGPVLVLLLAVAPSEIVAAFARPDALNAVRTSLFASLASLALATLLGVPGGFAIAHAPRTLRAITVFALALPLAFPPVASGIILLQVFGARSAVGAWLAAHGLPLVDSIGGVALAEFFVSGSLVVLASAAAFAVVEPAYEESAATLGASHWTIFRRIALPLAFPGIATGMLLAWLRALGEYGATSIVAYHPASLSIYLEVALAADGLHAALPLTYAFVLFAAVIVAVQWLLRNGLREVQGSRD